MTSKPYKQMHVTAVHLQLEIQHKVLQQQPPRKALQGLLSLSQPLCCQVFCRRKL